MASLHNSYYEVQLEKYFLRWYRRFNILNFIDRQNYKTINLLKQLSNVVLKNAYLTVLNELVLGSNNKIRALFIKLLLSISKICIRTSKDGILPTFSLDNLENNLNLQVIKCCHIILYRLLPSLLMKFLSIRSIKANKTKHVSIGAKKNLYSLLINISQMTNNNVIPKKPSESKTMYSLYKAMSKGNARSALKNAIIHFHRLRTCNFKLSDNDIYKEVKKLYTSTHQKDSIPDYINNFVPPTNCFEQNNVTNMGSNIITCTEFIAKGLGIDVGVAKTKNIDRLLLKCHSKLNKIKSFGANTMNSPPTGEIEYSDKAKPITGRKSGKFYSLKNTFRDSYLKLLEVITDANNDTYSNTQSLELTGNDLTRLIITHGEIRRMIWGPALIRHMKPVEYSDSKIKNDQIVKIKKFSRIELDRVLAINAMLERMSLTLGFSKPSWLAAAQNHTDSYILKS